MIGCQILSLGEHLNFELLKTLTDVNRKPSENRRNRGHNPPLEEVDLIRNIILEEAQKYLKKHPESEVKAMKDKPRRTNQDIYVGRDGHKCGGWFDVDEYFNTKEV